MKAKLELVRWAQLAIGANIKHIEHEYIISYIQIIGSRLCLFDHEAIAEGLYALKPCI